MMNKDFWKVIPKCDDCGKESTALNMLCSSCGGLMGVPPISAELPKIVKNMWGFSSFLPNVKKPFTLIEGATPVLQLSNIEELKGISVKLEFRNPTKSFRDRASSLLTSVPNIDHIISSSTGSYGISLAAYCGAKGIQSTTIIPQNIELSKIEQLKIFGSNVIEHGKNIKEAEQLLSEKLENSTYFHPHPRNNILTIEGQKTLGLEIAQYLAQENVASKIDKIFIPQGSGSLIISIYRGLSDALYSGWIKTLPKIISVSIQEESEHSYLIESLSSDSLSSLAIKQKEKVQMIVKKTKGEAIEVDPDKVVDDALLLARKEGLFIEPASASAITAVKHFIQTQNIKPESALVILTGSGLNALNIFASKLRMESSLKKVVWGLSPSLSTRKFEILNLIAENKSNNGTSIWKSFGEKKSLQSIYQHLKDLLDKNLILQTASASKKSKKEYIISRKGAEVLSKMRDLMDLV